MISLKQDWKQWAEALESGEYLQTIGRMGNEKDGFCCVAVRCLIHNVSFESEDFLPSKDIFENRVPVICGTNIIAFNDKYYYSFKQIAAKIREHAARKGWT